MSKVVKVENKKRLVQILENINPALRMWERWEAMMNVIACMLSIPIETEKTIREQRLDTFNHYMEILNNKEAVSEFFDALIEKRSPLDFFLSMVSLSIVMRAISSATLEGVKYCPFQ